MRWGINAEKIIPSLTEGMDSLKFLTSSENTIADSDVNDD